jgi:hypothetical protein
VKSREAKRKEKSFIGFKRIKDLQNDSHIFWENISLGLNLILIVLYKHFMTFLHCFPFINTFSQSTLFASKPSHKFPHSNSQPHVVTTQENERKFISYFSEKHRCAHLIFTNVGVTQIFLIIFTLKRQTRQTDFSVRQVFPEKSSSFWASTLKCYSIIWKIVKHKKLLEK